MNSLKSHKFTPAWEPYSAYKNSKDTWNSSTPRVPTCWATNIQKNGREWIPQINFRAVCLSVVSYNSPGIGKVSCFTRKVCGLFWVLVLFFFFFKKKRIIILTCKKQTYRYLPYESEYCWSLKADSSLDYALSSVSSPFHLPALQNKRSHRIIRLRFPFPERNKPTVCSSLSFQIHMKRYSPSELT